MSRPCGFGAKMISSIKISIRRRWLGGKWASCGKHHSLWTASERRGFVRTCRRAFILHVLRSCFIYKEKAISISLTETYLFDVLWDCIATGRKFSLSQYGCTLTSSSDVIYEEVAMIWAAELGYRQKVCGLLSWSQKITLHRQQRNIYYILRWTRVARITGFLLFET